MVMITFSGLPDNEKASQVHHQDGDKSNNRLDNLEWVTRSQNISHYYASLKGRSSKPSLCKPVAWRKLGTKIWETSESVALAAKKLGICAYTVSKCCRGFSSVKGYEIRFRNPSKTPLQERDSLAGEEWRPMLDPLSGLEVPGRMTSSLGRITSRVGLVYKGYLTAAGYYATQVLGQKHFVHRLVALAFLGPPLTDNLYVNHKDLDKGNNAANNLEYVTPAQNRTHYFANAVRKGVPNVKPVWSRRVGSDGDWTWHPSGRIAARALLVHASGVTACIHGKQRQTGGYEFCLDVSDAATLPGEEWRNVDLRTLRLDRQIRQQRNT